MKNVWRISRKLFVASSLALASIVTFTGCDDDDDIVDNDYTVSGTASGSQMVPSVTGTATGNFTGNYNANSNVLTYNMTWNGLTGTATSARFYTGATAGTNGTELGLATISTPGATGGASGTVTLTDLQETALLGGAMYYTVSTGTNTNGEIRGQLTAVR